MSIASDNQFPKLILTEGSTPAAAASGTQKLFIDSADHMPKLINSSGSVATLGGADYILIRDEKSSTTNGGTFTSGAWRTRDLNTEVNDAGGHASVSGNQITLAAGTYRAAIVCPAYSVDFHQAKLYNITDAADVLLGMQTFAKDAYTANTSNIMGQFTITTSKTLEVQHRCSTSHSTNGLGVAAGLTTEIYTVVELWKVA